MTSNSFIFIAFRSCKTDVLRFINGFEDQPRKSYNRHETSYQEESKEVQETQPSKRNTDSTNTRADAAKYPAYTPFAYRPADSPTHILKSKNDLIKIINQDLHNERIQTYELETDISRLQHQRDMAIKRKQENMTKW